MLKQDYKLSENKSGFNASYSRQICFVIILFYEFPMIFLW